ncbi:hypothetical protein BJ508DRAFT_321278 [Ascobolus immersus RN42]|uniref:Uncharacterized protein n=1 Tax=Ascobolus immersus RN42 TaxID=1160509 RepID=A0A3N4IKL6_ASCIM|nr:hypothetical protein BJ508DRAFT_321278 [Ascobolus immersus RN42]
MAILITLSDKAQCYAAPKIAIPLPTACFQAMEDAGILRMKPGDAQLQYSLESITKYSPHFNVYYLPSDNYTETNEAYYHYLSAEPEAWYTVRNFTAAEHPDKRNGTEVMQIGNPRYWPDWAYYDLVRSPVVDHACMIGLDGYGRRRCITPAQAAAADKKDADELLEMGRYVC